MTTTTLLEQLDQIARAANLAQKDFAIQRGPAGWRVTLAWVRTPTAARWCSAWCVELGDALTDALTALRHDQKSRP